MKILFIEDHPRKQAQIIEFLRSQFADLEIVTKNAYNSGLRELISNHANYDILLLDISMPNYDISSQDSGGDWMPLAGKKNPKTDVLKRYSNKGYSSYYARKL
jgi:CheY-like chemotaxis protein